MIGFNRRAQISYLYIFLHILFSKLSNWVSRSELVPHKILALITYKLIASMKCSKNTTRRRILTLLNIFKPKRLTKMSDI
jgi:hypothetical protein